MKTEPATGFTALAQRDTIWNTGGLLLAGGTYYGVARQLDGLPNVAVRWAAGASAAAVGFGGLAIRHRLLSAYAMRFAQAVEKEEEQAVGRLEVALATHRSSLQPPVLLAVGEQALELCMQGGALWQFPTSMAEPWRLPRGDRL